MTSASALATLSLTSSSRFRQRGMAGELGLEEPADFLVRQAARAQLVDRGGDGRQSGFHRVGLLLRAGAARDERAGAVAQLDDALVLELAVRLGDRVRIDDELFGERTDAGQLFAGAERPGFDAVLHLLHELKGDGHAGRRIRSKQHWLRCTSPTVLLN